MTQQRLVNRGVLILVLIAISALFLRLIAPFLQAIFVAALFAALFTPLYIRFLGWTGERRALSSALTMLTVLTFVFVPIGVVFTAVVAQALEIAESTRPWVQQQLAAPGTLTALFESLPFYERIEPFRATVIERLGQFAGAASGWLVALLQSLTLGTLTALITGLIVLYTMFFFLMDGDRLLYYMLYYLPLNDEDETKLLSRFMSVTKATLKGTAVIGFLQGGLAGLALWLAGIPSALFWAVAMMFLSVVPGIGTALIWIPAVVYLIVDGAYVEAIGGRGVLHHRRRHRRQRRPPASRRQRHPAARAPDLLQHARGAPDVRLHGVRDRADHRGAVRDGLGPLRLRVPRVAADDGVPPEERAGGAPLPAARAHQREEHPRFRIRAAAERSRATVRR